MQIQSASKIKIFGQKQVYGEDLRSLTSETKNWATIIFPEGLENTPFTLLQDISNENDAILLQSNQNNMTDCHKFTLFVFIII